MITSHDPKRFVKNKEELSDLIDLVAEMDLAIEICISTCNFAMANTVSRRRVKPHSEESRQERDIQA